MPSLAFLQRILPDLLAGLQITLALALSTMAISLAAGSLLAIGTRTRAGPLIAGYVELARNIPLLLQLYVAYFGFAVAGWPLPGFACALVALCWHHTAYVTEIVRGGIDSVHVRQFEAARALGMRSAGVYRHVVMPQALVRAIPVLTNQAVIAVKDTSLAAAIAVMELMKMTQVWVEQSAAVYELFTVVALIYVVVNTAVTVLGALAERRFAHGR